LELARINDRHFLNRIRANTLVKANTTLIPPDLEAIVQAELDAIERGQGTRSLGNRITVESGRTYVDEGNGTYFPADGPDLIGPVERGVMRALCVLARYNGPNESSFRQLGMERGVRQEDIDDAARLWSLRTRRE
jgi:hypothetical protein